MVAEGRLEEIALAEGADWHYAVGELNKAQITALSAAERVMREKAEAEAATMKTKVCGVWQQAQLCSPHRCRKNSTHYTYTIHHTHFHARAPYTIQTPYAIRHTPYT